jgi:molybdenum cofactor cytidylyltransferase
MIALLAAGQARRFGGGKLEANLGGRSLGLWAYEVARQVTLETELPLIVIVPPDGEAFWEKQVQDAPHAQAPVSIIPNPHAEQGMGSSVALAAAQAHALNAEKLLIMLADMPFVSADGLHSLLAAVSNGTNSAAATDYRIHQHSTRQADESQPAYGVPACFSAQHFPALMALAPHMGAQAVLRKCAELRLVSMPARELIDIDTQEQLMVQNALLKAQ